MLLNPDGFLNSDRESPQCQPKLLNVGCGSHFHRHWVNIDLISESLDVVAHDLTCGLPFEDGHFDAVYHSHVLEHLNPTDGVKLIEECFRVLKPGGIVRIVVPDLEQIAELYLEMHHRAWSGDEDAKTDYDWMKLELLDQLVRDRSGGRMGQYMADPAIKNSEFVRSRVGDEYRICRTHHHDSVDAAAGQSFLARTARRTRKLREAVAKKIVRILLGSNAETALDEGLFRHSGEVHRWMYDRFSLRTICEAIGFTEFTHVSAKTSEIANFSSYELDVVDGQIRKPDSLFAECRRPTNR